MSPVYPIFHEAPARRLQARAFALGDLVLVMGEDKVLSAQVQVKSRPENAHAHSAALDVPAGPAFAPGTGPEHLAIFGYPRLPKGKVGDRFLCIFIALNPLAGPHLVEVEFEQLTIAATAALVFFDAEIN